MKDRICGLHLLLIVLLVRNSASKHEVKDERGRQTFVVRYKSGEQTIPVTVVLDYKKQTEYVINMNPRTPAKSVTLYDFKQRTIAYKDLTNQECFLGHLTHETLTHESVALQEVKSPVDSRPKMLSLDPQSPALTPTEVRNIAGQKTAAFCRKMNTWLLKSVQSHSVKKREVDEEIEERVYGHHGYHTVQYSHYGHETRRRYRKPGRLNSRHESQKNQTIAANRNGEPVFSGQGRTLHEIHNIQPIYSYQFSTSDKGGNHPPPQVDGNGNLALKNTHDSAGVPALFNGASKLNQNNNGNEQPFKENPPNINSYPFSKIPRNNNEKTGKFHSDDDNYAPHSNPPNINTNFAYRIKSPSNFQAEFSSVVGDKTGDISNSLGPDFSHRTNNKSNEKDNFKYVPLDISKNTNSLNKPLYYNTHNNNADNFISDKNEHARRTERDSSTSEFPDPSFYRKNGYKRENLYPSLNLNGNRNIETHIPFRKADFYPQNHHRLIEANPLPAGRYDNNPINRNIETESLSRDSLSSHNETGRARFTNREGQPEISLNPDVSVSVLEIPRFTHKFENLTVESNPTLPVLRNEDNHNVLSGFYDSKGNHPVLEHDYFYNPYVHHNVLNQNQNSFRSRSTHPLGSIPVPQNNDPITSRHFEHSNIPSYLRSVTNPAHLSAPSTPGYEHVPQEPTTPTSPKLVAVTAPASVSEKSNGQSTLNKFLYQENNFPPNRYETVNNPLRPDHFRIQSSNFHQDNSLGLIPNAFVTTEASATHENRFGNSDHRSDIPSEDGDIEAPAQTATPPTADSIPNKIHSQYPAPNNSGNGSFPPHQVRFQSVLRHFKPDEIVIDIENIPTPQPSESTSGFQHRRIVANQTPLKSSEISAENGRRSEQTSGPTWRSSHVESTRHPRRRINKLPKEAQNGVSFHVRTGSVSWNRQFNNSHGIIQPMSFDQHQISRQPPVHSGHYPSQLHQFHPPLRFDSSHQFNGRQQFDSEPKLHVLPPGVSMHPRHPQAPYADMVHSNRLPNIHQRTVNPASFQPHRQRHHRKKDRNPNSCCRMTGKPSALQACCRSGGHCCSGSRARTQQLKTPCCPSNKVARSKKLFSPNQLPARAEFRPQDSRRTLADGRDHCQKEKMCRTLYESTQQVMVCRSANIEGC